MLQMKKTLSLGSEKIVIEDNHRLPLNGETKVPRSSFKALRILTLHLVSLLWLTLAEDSKAISVSVNIYSVY